MYGYDDDYEVTGDEDYPVYSGGSGKRWSKKPAYSERELVAGVAAIGDAEMATLLLDLTHAYAPLRGWHLSTLASLHKTNAVADDTLLDKMCEQGLLAYFDLGGIASDAYLLGEVGEAYLRYLGRKRVPRNMTAIYDRPHSRLEHDVGVADILVPAMLALKSEGGSLKWYRAATSPDRSNHSEIRWDAYCQVEIEELAISFVLEYDRGSESNLIIGDKVRDYSSYLSQNTWQVALGCRFRLPILMVTTGNSGRLSHMKQAISDALARLEYPERQSWWLTNHDRIAAAARQGHTSPLLAPVWDRPDDEHTSEKALAAELFLIARDEIKAATDRYAQVTGRGRRVVREHITKLQTGVERLGKRWLGK